MRLATATPMPRRALARLGVEPPSAGDAGRYHLYAAHWDRRRPTRVPALSAGATARYRWARAGRVGEGLAVSVPGRATREK